MANQATKSESVMQCGYKYTVAVYTGGGEWGGGFMYMVGLRDKNWC